MKIITFSHQYPKLHLQSSAILVDVTVMRVEDLSAPFVEYDSQYYDDDGLQHYPLPTTGPILRLTFIGEWGIPFSTVRRWTPEKEAYYMAAKNQRFHIAVQFGGKHKEDLA